MTELSSIRTASQSQRKRGEISPEPRKLKHANPDSDFRITKLVRFRLAAFLSMTGWQIVIVDYAMNLQLADHAPWLVSWWLRWGIMLLGMLTVVFLFARGVFCQACGHRCDWQLPYFRCVLCNRKYDPGRIRGVD